MKCKKCNTVMKISYESGYGKPFYLCPKCLCVGDYIKKKKNSSHYLM